MITLAPARPSAPGSARRHTGLALLLGALLLLAQVAALAHGLTHLSDHEDGDAAHAPACEWCLNLSQLGAAAPAAGLCLPERGGDSLLLDGRALATPTTSLPYCYHSRAPPYA